jgi:hypothetical protein
VHRGNQQLEPFRETFPQPTDSMRVFIAVTAAGKQMKMKIFMLKANVKVRDLKITDAISEALSAHAHSQINRAEN